MKWVPILNLLLLITGITNAQCPQNIGFEDGTFGKWQCYAGEIYNTGFIYLQPYPPLDGTHNIMSASSIPDRDPYGGFPVLCPNGSKYSVKLGNNNADQGAERMSYTFEVPAGQDYSLVLNYAVVLQNPGHLEFEQPRFKVQIYNVTDDKYLDCPSFDFVSSSDLPGFQQGRFRGSPVDVLYKDWSSTSINLIGYAGKTMRLEFTTNDCARGGHFGYAYFDIIENCSTAITGNTYCSGQTAVTLIGPSGFAKYKWYNDQDLSTVIDTGSILKVTPAPPNGTRYTLKVEPYLGIGCADILHTIISKVPAGFTFNVIDSLFICKGSSVDLSTAISAGTTPGLNISYFIDPALSTYVKKPKAISEEGTYYIRATSAEGCLNAFPVYVKVLDLSQFQVKDIHVTYPAKADLSTAIIAQPKTQYQFFTDAAATKQLSNYYAVDPGHYYVKVTTDLGCETIAPVVIIGDPPPPYVISAPTAFTPNADGVNDIFSISIKGYVSLEKLKIFNRYGTPVFEGKTNTWDGALKGRVVAPGTYYWMLDGKNDYDGSRVRKTGVITLVK